MKNNKLQLSAIEALYLLDVRNGKCKSGSVDISFSEIASKFTSAPKFIARYFSYKDWRERGLVVKEGDSENGETSKNSTKIYPASSLHLPKYSLRVFFKSDLTTILDDNEKGKELYERFWFGQYGSYKAAERGQLNKLDAYETLFLMDKSVLSLGKTTRPILFRVQGP